MREVAINEHRPMTAATSFAACLATILELALEDVPEPADGEDVAGWQVTRWLGGLGLGIVPVADATSFAWAGPWIGLVHPAEDADRAAVVMYGVPSGVAWDPSGVTAVSGWQLEAGFVIAGLDIALARPGRATPPVSVGAVEAIWVAPDEGAPPRTLDVGQALAGRGLEGDRHVAGTSTFPSGAGKRPDADRGRDLRVVRTCWRRASIVATSSPAGSRSTGSWGRNSWSGLCVVGACGFASRAP